MFSSKKLKPINAFKVDEFPPVPSDVSNRHDIKEMDVISNLEITKDLEFNHEFIQGQIEKFSITPTLCNKCNMLSKHFMDPTYFINELYLKNSKWILNPNSKLTMDMSPYNKLTVPIFDINNVSLVHPDDRPRGKVHLCREASAIINKPYFVRQAKTSSLSALRRLKNKPYMCLELAHKLSEDVDQGVLMKLDDYLELPEVKELGITRQSAHANIVPSAIHLVANLSSASSPIRLVVAPNRPDGTTRQSINSALHSGLPQLPAIQQVLLKYRLSLSLCISDLCAFYKRNILDPAGSLMSAIYLQGNPGSKYPTLDPENPDPLIIWVFRCANFGYADASSLSATAKNLIGTFYRKYFPEGLHKMSEQDILFCEVLLKEAYSDDVLIPIYLSMVAQENLTPSFPHPENWS